jgi:lipopolysaccharide export system permease protein
MLFHSSLRKELARSFGATLIVLVTVVMTMTLIRTLGQASRGSFNPSDVMMVVGYTVLTFLPNVMVMGLFVATVATLTRLYRDSEMVIWFGAGMGLRGLVAPLFRFSWPILLAVGALALFVLPWANGQIEDIKDHYEQRGDLERVEPGRFQESADGSRVFFVDKTTVNERTGNNVFIATTENGKQTVTTARGGRVENIGQDQFLLLERGQRLESALAKTPTNQSDLKISEFEEYGAKIGVAPLSSKDKLPLNVVSSRELVQNPTARTLGELSWRLGFVLAAANLMIIAIASSRINPRVGRTGNLVFSMFAFQVYLNFLNLGQNWIAAGEIGFATFMLALHGGVLLVGLIWLTKRHNNWGWLPPAGFMQDLRSTRRGALGTHL